jgi:molybdenum cofactor guanylyltransferase
LFLRPFCTKTLYNRKNIVTFSQFDGDEWLLERSAIILAGGSSTRLGQDKGLAQLAGKSLINHVLDRTKNLVEETLVVVSSKLQAEKYGKISGSDTRIIIDNAEVHGPLVGANVGFREASGTYSLLLPCDAPFISKDILQLLLELCVNKNAAIPRWPNCYIEPLQAVYCTEAAIQASKEAVSSGEVKMQAMVDKLRGVRYISTLVLEQLDPGLNTFINVNTVFDLKKAEALVKRR